MFPLFQPRNAVAPLFSKKRRLKDLSSLSRCISCWMPQAALTPGQEALTTSTERETKPPGFLFPPQRCPAPSNRDLERCLSLRISGYLVDTDLAPRPFLMLGENTNLHSSALQDALGRGHRSFIYGWISRHRKAPWWTASWPAEL